MGARQRVDSMGLRLMITLIRSCYWKNNLFCICINNLTAIQLSTAIERKQIDCCVIMHSVQTTKTYFLKKKLVQQENPNQNYSIIFLLRCYCQIAKVRLLDRNENRESIHVSTSSFSPFYFNNTKYSIKLNSSFTLINSGLRSYFYSYQCKVHKIYWTSYISETGCWNAFIFYFSQMRVKLSH